MLLRNRDIQREKNRGSRIDGHRGRNVFKRDAVEQRFHVFERIDSDANLADFARRARMIGVVSDLRGQVESNRQSCLPLGQQVTKTFVRLRRRAEPGVLPHGPETPTIHRGINPARVRKFSGKSDRRFGIAAR